MPWVKSQKLMATVLFQGQYSLPARNKRGGCSRRCQCYTLDCSVMSPKIKIDNDAKLVGQSFWPACFHIYATHQRATVEYSRRCGKLHGIGRVRRRGGLISPNASFPAEALCTSTWPLLLARVFTSHTRCRAAGKDTPSGICFFLACGVEGNELESRQPGG